MGYWHPTSKLSCQCLKYEEWTLIIFHFVHALTPIIYQIFSGLVFSPPELRLTAFVIESFLLLTTMQTSSPFLLWSPESFLHWLAKLWVLSVRSMALSTPSAPRPVLLLPPRDRMLRPMLAKLDPLDSESVRLNLLKWSWKTGTETVGRRSC